jgi:biotin synthase
LIILKTKSASLLKKRRKEISMNRRDVIKGLQSSGKQLFMEADRIRYRFCGDEVHLRGIIEFSNFCRRDCFYCGLRKSNDKITRYRMSDTEIIGAAKEAVKLGYKTIVLQSGEDDHYKAKDIAKIVKRIKKEADCAVTLCLGEQTFDDYKILKQAGADRYLLKFETSSRSLFAKLRPGCSLEDRLRCLRWLKELGFQTGSGNIVGLPGQTAEILARDILLINKLQLDMVGIGPFIPHPETPLGREAEGSLELSLKVIALVRILTQNTHLPATTAIGTLHPEGRQLALSCGANVVMPNITPHKYRKLYEIYPGKICLDEKPSDCRRCIEKIIVSISRRVSCDYGHSLKKPRNLCNLRHTV